MTIYLIIPCDECTDEMIAGCKQTSHETLRHTVAGVDRVLLSVPTLDDLPASLSEYKVYSYEAIHELLMGSEWFVANTVFERP